MSRRAQGPLSKVSATAGHQSETKVGGAAAAASVPVPVTVPVPASMPADAIPVLSVDRDGTLIGVSEGKDLEGEYDTFNAALHPALVTAILYYLGSTREDETMAGKKVDQPLFITTNYSKREALGRIYAQACSVFPAIQDIKARERLLIKVTLGHTLELLGQQISNRHDYARSRIRVITPHSLVRSDYMSEVLRFERDTVARFLTYSTRDEIDAVIERELQELAQQEAKLLESVPGQGNDNKIGLLRRINRLRPHKGIVHVDDTAEVIRAMRSPIRVESEAKPERVAAGAAEPATFSVESYHFDESRRPQAGSYNSAQLLEVLAARYGLKEAAIARVYKYSHPSEGLFYQTSLRGHALLRELGVIRYLLQCNISQAFKGISWARDPRIVKGWVQELFAQFYVRYFSHLTPGQRESLLAIAHTYFKRSGIEDSRIQMQINIALISAAHTQLALIGEQAGLGQLIRQLVDALGRERDEGRITLKQYITYSSKVTELLVMTVLRTDVSLHHRLQYLASFTHDLQLRGTAYVSKQVLKSLLLITVVVTITVGLSLLGGVGIGALLGHQHVFAAIGKALASMHLAGSSFGAHTVLASTVASGAAAGAGTYGAVRLFKEPQDSKGLAKEIARKVAASEQVVDAAVKVGTFAGGKGGGVGGGAAGRTAGGSDADASTTMSPTPLAGRTPAGTPSGTPRPR